jgi:hypothetical protein
MVAERETAERVRADAQQRAAASAHAAAAEADADAERAKVADAAAEEHALETARVLLGEAAVLEALMRNKTREAMAAAEVAQKLAAKR